MVENKEDFFRDLDKLGDLSDGEDVASEFAQLVRNIQTTHYSTRPISSTSLPLGRVSPIESPSPSFSEARRKTFYEKKVKKKGKECDIKPTPLEKTVFKEQSNSDNNIRGTKRTRQASKQQDKTENSSKKKKESWPGPLRYQPESRQIFKGLSFFFVPNNDVDRQRKFLIHRCREHGAHWAQSWTEDITHVIAGEGLTVQCVLDTLRLNQFPPHIALVDRLWPSLCIASRALRDVNEYRFRVKESERGQTRHVPTDSSESALKVSLRLKQPRRWGRRTHSPTPEREEEPSRKKLHIVQLEPSTSENCLDESSLEKSRPNINHDLLEESIEEVKATQELLLGDDDDDDDEIILHTNSNSSDALNSEPKVSQQDQDVPEWQKNFACMQRHEGKPLANNPNMRTIELLQKLVEYNERMKDGWRTTAYRKAITALRKQSTKISTKTQALAIPCIGESIAEKIEEIAHTDRLRRLENINLTTEDKALKSFLGVYGVGIAQASRWVAKGYRSLADLRTKAKLSDNQRVGLEHYDDFQQRIPRAEVAAHGKVVREAILSVDPDMEVIIAGSYRRGAADSGDIDVLITKANASVGVIRNIMMQDVVPKLLKQGFLKVSLATSSRSDGSKWYGASALSDSGVWRRIDLLFVPGNEVGAAMLYFTGNDIFNRSMRLLARKKGMCLNQHGLFKDTLRVDHMKTNRGSLVEGRDEKRIFAELGVPWRPPEHRIP